MKNFIYILVTLNTCILSSCSKETNDVNNASSENKSYFFNWSCAGSSIGSSVCSKNFLKETGSAGPFCTFAACQEWEKTNMNTKSSYLSSDKGIQKDSSSYSSSCSQSASFEIYYQPTTGSCM